MCEEVPLLIFERPLHTHRQATPDASRVDEKWEGIYITGEGVPQEVRQLHCKAELQQLELSYSRSRRWDVPKRLGCAEGALSRQDMIGDSESHCHREAWWTFGRRILQKTRPMLQYIPPKFHPKQDPKQHMVNYVMEL